MRLRINEQTVIPAQDLEGKTAGIGKIVEILSCDREGASVEGRVEDSNFVRIETANRCYSAGGSGMTLTGEEYVELKKGYEVDHYFDLLGKPVFTVYNPQKIISGLIPLKMDL